MGTPAFLTDDSLYPTPAAYRLVSQLTSEGRGLTFVVLAFMDLFFLTLVSLGLWILFQLFPRRPTRAPWYDWLFHAFLGGIAFLGLVFLVLLAGLVVQTMFANGAMLLFGLPSGASVLFLLPYLMVLLASGLLILLAHAWLKRDLSVARRLLYSLLTVAAFGFLAFLGYWDLLRL